MALVFIRPPQRAKTRRSTGKAAANYLSSQGSLVDPRLRVSNEHILIVRVPRAGGGLGYPSLSIS